MPRDPNGPSDPRSRPSEPFRVGALAEMRRAHVSLAAIIVNNDNVNDGLPQQF
jgi:hypothetical protein